MVLNPTMIGVLVFLGVAFLFLAGAVVIIMKLCSSLFKDPNATKRPEPSTNYTFRRRRFFSETERAFYLTLRDSVRDQFVVAPKVGLWNLVETVPYCHAGWNKIAQKHVDFVLCNVKTMEAVLAIELDDPSHNSAKAQQRDADKDAILRAAGMPLLRVPTARSYDLNALRDSIRETIRRGGIGLFGQ